MEGSEKEIKLKIDGLYVKAIEGTAVLDAAKKLGIKTDRLIFVEHDQ
jgi:predicted molibdopterin-dependent oxidoreductase YjgC